MRKIRSTIASNCLFLLAYVHNLPLHKTARDDEDRNEVAESLQDVKSHSAPVKFSDSLYSVPCHSELTHWSTLAR